MLAWLVKNTHTATKLLNPLILSHSKAVIPTLPPPIGEGPLKPPVDDLATPQPPDPYYNEPNYYPYDPYVVHPADIIVMPQYPGHPCCTIYFCAGKGYIENVSPLAQLNMQ